MSAPHHTPSRAGLASVSAAALLWGTAGVVVRIVHQHAGLSAVSIGCYRLAIAALALGLVLGPRGVRLIRASFLRHPLLLIAAGAGLGLYQALYLLGVQNVGVSVSTLVSLGTAPVVITAWTAWLRRRLPAPRSLVVLGAALTGLGLISLPSGNTASVAPHPLLGLIASIGSGLGYAASTLVNARLACTDDPLALSASTSAIGALLLLPIALLAGMSFPIGSSSTAWLVYLGVVTTSVAYGLFFTGLRSTPSEVAAVLTLLEPLTAMLLAVAVLHERLSAAAAVGAVLLLAAVCALYLRRPEPAVAPPAYSSRAAQES